MKAQEKQIIYDLLKTTDSAINGFTSASFLQVPLFTDDEEKPEGTPSESSDSSLVLQTIDEVQKESPVSSKTSPVSSSALTLEEINSKIARCTRCALARTRNSVVPGMGVQNPEVLVIGEGPGYNEDLQGLPFVGKAGALLDKMLNAIGLDRNKNCFIANVVKCRPPEDRDPAPEEMSACSGFLEAQIKILKPKMILCMGRIAGHKMLKTETPLNQLHGKLFEYDAVFANIPLMVTYHPSALLRNVELKKPAWEDLKAFRAKLNSVLEK